MEWSSTACPTVKHPFSVWIQQVVLSTGHPHDLPTNRSTTVRTQVVPDGGRSRLAEDEILAGAEEAVRCGAECGRPGQTSAGPRWWMKWVRGVPDAYSGFRVEQPTETKQAVRATNSLGPCTKNDATAGVL